MSKILWRIFLLGVLVNLITEIQASESDLLSIYPKFPLPKAAEFSVQVNGLEIYVL